MSAVHTGNGGLVIEVSDIGLGMAESDLRVANTRLQSGGEVNPYTARHMGLFVVGRLAAQHGLVVRLRSTIAGEPNSGTTAGVYVPVELLRRRRGARAARRPRLRHACRRPRRDRDSARTRRGYTRATSRRARSIATATPSFRSRFCRSATRAPAASRVSRVVGHAGGRATRRVARGGLAGRLDARADAARTDRAGAASGCTAVERRGVLRLPRRCSRVNGAPSHEPATEPAHELSPTAGSDDAIYQEMLSEWLDDPFDLAKSADLNWETVWDHGWAAAEAAEDAPVDEHTEEGLPVREPGARLVPGAVDDAGTDAPTNGGHSATEERAGATTATTR